MRTVTITPVLNGFIVDNAINKNLGNLSIPTGGQLSPGQALTEEMPQASSGNRQRIEPRR